MCYVYSFVMQHKGIYTVNIAKLYRNIYFVQNMLWTLKLSKQLKTALH